MTAGHGGRLPAAGRVTPDHVVRLMRVFEDLMAGKGLAATELAGLGPCAIGLVDARGWRADGLHRVRGCLERAVAGFVRRGDAAGLRKGHTAPAVAASVRAAVGLSHYPVPDRLAEGGERRTDSGNVAAWRAKVASVALTEVQRWCDREWAGAGRGHVAPPAEDYPYWCDAPADWPPPWDLRALTDAAERVMDRLSPRGRETVTPRTLTLIGRAWALREADRYLDLTRFVRQAGATAVVPGLKNGVRARSFLQHDVVAAWRPPALFLGATDAPAVLARPSAFKGADLFREAGAAALALAFHRLTCSPDLLVGEIASYVATTVLGGTARAGSRKDLALTLSAAEMKALHDLVAPPRPTLDRPGNVSADWRALDGPVSVRALCELATLSRNQPLFRSGTITQYIELRRQLGPLDDPDSPFPPHERRALARADQSVEWDAVHYSGRTGGQAGLLERLQQVITRFPSGSHRGYATHRHRGKAVAANKNGHRHTALHWAMLGHFDLENLRRAGLVTDELELLEAGHQHALCITGIWVKWLEEALAHGDRLATPAWVHARYAHHWAARTRHRLERLGAARPLPRTKVWWTEDESDRPGISTRRWLVQTTRLYLRAQLGARTALLAGLATVDDLTGVRADRAGPPIPEASLGPEAVLGTYRELLRLTEITAQADGPETTQLALWIGFLSDGGIPAVEVSDDNAAAELSALGHLVPSPDVYAALPVHDGFRRIELDTVAATRYLRSRNWDAGLLGRVSVPPPRGGTRGQGRVFHALDRTGAFRSWRAAWDCMESEAAT
ncbi:hypothetical protein [Streptomyces sp. NPDC003247]|uniref:hypothetical protein n=1 Tax=Streptomyces sp. NPDC003247 TaxID=3364677 RepID=UPI0036B703CE